ncbi:hypothetical protein ACFSSA_09600 [Luteolibacter algae]|uniref:Septum formation initiator family protein n=1 Tax=Luteolibacter algae TaxID=454151 RepID=A0ABW5DBX2_9BACT
MAKKKFTAQRLARVERATRFVQGLNRIFCICAAIAFGLLIAANAVPQKKEYEKLQTKLRSVREREEATLAIKEYKQVQLHALREDTSYLELQARDRLNYYREGERILRFDPNR